MSSSPVSPSLTLGGKIVLGAGVLFLISTLLPWYSVSLRFLGRSQSDTANAWQVTLPKIAAILVLVVLAEVIVTQLANWKLPTAAPGFYSLSRLTLSGVAALLVLIELVKGHDTGLSAVNTTGDAAGSLLSSVLGGDQGLHLSVSRSVGMFLGVIFVLALVAGNVLRLRETPAPVTSGGQPSGPGFPGPAPTSEQPSGQPGFGPPNQSGQPGES